MAPGGVAAADGVLLRSGLTETVQEYLRQRLIEEAAMPTVEEVLERAGGRAGGFPTAVR
jgi:hypothetical protein